MHSGSSFFHSGVLFLSSISVKVIWADFGSISYPLERLFLILWNDYFLDYVRLLSTCLYSNLLKIKKEPRL